MHEMVLESTMICIDNSEYMRNEDFAPSRFLAQNETVHLICRSKVQENPENTVGLVSMSNAGVVASLTRNVNVVLSRLYRIRIEDSLKFKTSLEVAKLPLKHRENKSSKMRIVAFVGSPLRCDDADLQHLALKFRKENVDVSVVNLEVINDEILLSFVQTVNGKQRSGSNLLNVTAVQPSAINGFEEDDDPELRLALQLSLEEERRRQGVFVQDYQEEQSSRTGSTFNAVEDIDDALAILSTTGDDNAPKNQQQGAPKASEEEQDNDTNSGGTKKDKH